MKAYLLKITTALLLVFFAACGSSNTPKSVAESFLKAMNKMDFETAKKYGTEDTGKLLDMMSGFAKIMPDSAKKEHKIEMLTEKIDGDKATVTYKEDDKKEESMPMAKVDGKWKVAMSKDSMNEGVGNGTDSGSTASDSTMNAMDSAPDGADSTAKK